MAGKDKKPDIRFSEFKGAWEQRKLGEIYKERNERGDDSLPILSVSIRHGVSNEELDSDTLGKKVRRSEDKSLYKHVYFGDLVLNMMRAWQGAIGVVKSEGMVSPAYITAIPDAQLYPLFMDYCLRRDETIIQINNLSYGVTDFRKRLYWDSFINVLCHIPSVPEQERIAAIFAHIDNLITLQQRKYEKLIIIKKSTVEKMFPEHGANVPEIRFAGFTGAWEKRRLGEVIMELEGYTTLKSGYPLLTSSRNGLMFQDEYRGNVTTYNENTLFSIVPYGKCTYRHMSDDDIFHFNINYIVENGLVSREYPVFDAYGHNCLSFIVEYLNSSNRFISFCKEQKKGGTRTRLYYKNLCDFTLFIPQYDEQLKIATFLSNLDRSITLHRRKLEKMKNIKKAMLEKMFV
jgi:type I restriction enzyme S subunit